MCDKNYSLKSNGMIIAKNYVDVDNNQESYNLLIYQCTINNIDRNFVIGNVVDDTINIDKINEYINRIIFLRFNNCSPYFIFEAIHNAEKNGIFDKMNLSNKAYDLLLNCKPYEYFKEKFIFEVKETVIDNSTKRFSTIHTTPKPFHPISYYSSLEEVKEKNVVKLKTAI